MSSLSEGIPNQATLSFEKCAFFHILRHHFLVSFDTAAYWSALVASTSGQHTTTKMMWNSHDVAARPQQIFSIAMRVSLGMDQWCGGPVKSSRVSAAHPEVR